MQNQNIYPIDQNHSVIESTIHRLHTTNDKDGKFLPASATNRTLCLGFSSDGTPLLWIESEFRGRELATDDPEQFAELLSDLTDDDGIERSRYTRFLLGRDLFEKILQRHNNDFTPQNIESLREITAKAMAAVLSREVSFAYVNLILRRTWRMTYLPENAGDELASFALERLYAIFESHGLNTVSVDCRDNLYEDYIEIADDIGTFPPVELRNQVLTIVKESFEEWISWAKKLSPELVLDETAKGKTEAGHAKKLRGEPIA